MVSTQLTPTNISTHREPVVQHLAEKTECVITQIIWLTATNPDKPEPPEQRMLVVLVKKEEDSDTLLDLRTNDTSLKFICEVVRNHFSYAYSIFDTWALEDGIPF